MTSQLRQEGHGEDTEWGEGPSRQKEQLFLGTDEGKTKYAELGNCGGSV